MNTDQIYGINSNFIKLDKTTFNKTAKRLQTNLEDHINSELSEELPVFSTTLSAMQTVLAKSLGFRNTDAISTYFDKQHNAMPDFKTGHFLDSWTSPAILELINSIMYNSVDDGYTMWKNRSSILLNAVIPALVFLRETEGLSLSSNVIEECLNIDNVIALFKRTDLSTDITKNLHSYLKSIPGFDIARENQTETTSEQHGFLQMQFKSALDLLKNIELHDPIVISPTWYHAVYGQSSIFTNNLVVKSIAGSGMSHTLKSVLESNNNTPPPKPIKTTIRLSDDNMDEIYNKTSHEEWIEYFSRKTPDKFDMLTMAIRPSAIQEELKNDHEFHFQGIELINPIKHNSYLEDSWLEDQKFQAILNSILKNKQFKTFYLSDLLPYCFKVVNEEKRKLYMSCLFNLLRHYSTIVEYSSVLMKLAK